MTDVTEFMASSREDKSILIVDEDQMIRTRLQRFLTNHGYHVATVSDFDQMKRALSEQKYDLLITELVFAGKKNAGLDFIQHARGVNPNCDTIILTATPDTDSAIQAIRMKALDYFTKSTRNRDLLAAVEKGIGKAKKRDVHAVQKAPTNLLSQREREVLIHLFKGCNFNEVAQHMDCSFSTVKTYGQRAYKKLGVNSRSGAIHTALGRGLIARE